MARAIANKTGLTLVKAKVVVEAVLETMKETLSRDERHIAALGHL